MDNSKEGEEESTAEQQVEQPKGDKAFNKTTIFLTRSHDDDEGSKDCAYCKGKRMVDNPETGEKDVNEEKDLLYYKVGFTTTKVRIDDLETIFDQGWTRCGTYIYSRSAHKSCCEVFQYRVAVDDFKISPQQKKAIRRFHKYLNYGDVHAGDDKSSSDGGSKQPAASQLQQENTGAQQIETEAKINDMLSKAKQLVEKVVISEYVDKIDDIAEKEKEATSIQQSHKINMNPKLKVMQSNIFMLNKEKILLTKFKAQIESDLEKLLNEQLQATPELTAISKFEVVCKPNVCYVNGTLTPDAIAMMFSAQKQTSKQKGKQDKQKNKANKKNEGGEQQQIKCDAKYVKWQQYLVPHIPYEPVKQPKHLYEISVHRAIFTEELYELYRTYEKQVHDREVEDHETLNSHLCSSPAYDPENPNDRYLAERPAPLESKEIDVGKVFKDEGLYPGLGSFHIYHRLDGKLVGVGVVDLTNTLLNSEYFVWDQNYKFLSLGVISAIHELEYMKMIKLKFNPNILQYHLGEFSQNAPKINYKLNYKPGLLLCPRTKKMVPHELIKNKLKYYSKLPIEYKKEHHPCCDLVDVPKGVMLSNELQVQELSNHEANPIGHLPILYDGQYVIRLNGLNEMGRKILFPVCKKLLSELGVAFVFKRIMFEIKYPKKKPDNKDEEEQDQEEDKEENKDEGAESTGGESADKKEEPKE